MGPPVPPPPPLRSIAWPRAPGRARPLRARLPDRTAGGDAACMPHRAGGLRWPVRPGAVVELWALLDRAAGATWPECLPPLLTGARRVGSAAAAVAALDAAGIAADGHARPASLVSEGGRHAAPRAALWAGAGGSSLPEYAPGPWRRRVSIASAPEAAAAQRGRLLLLRCFVGVSGTTRSPLHSKCPGARREVDVFSGCAPLPADVRTADLQLLTCGHVMLPCWRWTLRAVEEEPKDLQKKFRSGSQMLRSASVAEAATVVCDSVVLASRCACHAPKRLCGGISLTNLSTWGADQVRIARNVLRRSAQWARDRSAPSCRAVVLRLRVSAPSNRPVERLVGHPFPTPQRALFWNL